MVVFNDINFKAASLNLDNNLAIQKLNNFFLLFKLIVSK